MSAAVLNAALEGLEAQKQRIESQIAAVRAELAHAPAGATSAAGGEARPQRKFSAATRRKMAEAQRRRYAALRGETAPPAPAAKKQPAKRKLSPQALANIRAGVKKRMAAAKKAKA